MEELKKIIVDKGFRIDDSLALSVCKAYAGLQGVENSDELRDLTFMTIDSCDGPELIKLMSAFVPVYGQFEGEGSCIKLVDLFGESARYYVGRDTTPVTYIRPVETVRISEEFEAFSMFCDNFSYSPSHKMFKVCW